MNCANKHHQMQKEATVVSGRNNATQSFIRRKQKSTSVATIYNVPIIVVCCHNHGYLFSLDEGPCCIFSETIVARFYIWWFLFTKFSLCLLFNTCCNAFYSILFDMHILRSLHDLEVLWVILFACLSEC